MTAQRMLELEETIRIAEEAADGSPLWWKIQALVEESDQLLVKKLSRNDTSWADESGGNQAGFYVPAAVRESGFFPPLEANNPDKPHIFVAELRVIWPQTGECTLSYVRHFSNKGAETHCTRLPKALFQDLTPASFVVVGRLLRPVGGCMWWMVVLDSSGEEAELLETMLDLPVDFHYNVLPAREFKSAQRAKHDELEELIEEFREAIQNNSLASLAARYAIIPDPATIARRAREQWLKSNGHKTFNPWEIPSPGDAIMEISREIEFSIYRRHELRRRAAELLSILSGGNDLPSTVVRKYPEIDAVLLSASQQRKTRAGRSFEHHIAAALAGGNITFQEQAVTGGRRPDFVMPDVKKLRSRRRNRADALVLAAKTTLRERWKQVSSERLNCDTFLATVDDRVARTSIDEMTNAGIQLVVPESLKKTSEADYAPHDGVITFRDFFDREIRLNRPFLVLSNV